jgi:hypothetical protein
LFSEHRTLDPDSWKRIGENVRKALQRGENIHIHFFGMWSSIHYCLGPLADLSKEGSELSLLEDNKNDYKKDNKEEEKPPPQKHENFSFPLWRILHHLMLAFTHHWPHFRLILRLVPYLRQEQNRESKMKKFP